MSRKIVQDIDVSYSHSYVWRGRRNRGKKYSILCSYKNSMEHYRMFGEVKEYKNKVFFDIIKFVQFACGTSYTYFEGIFSNKMFPLRNSDVEEIIFSGGNLNYVQGFFTHRTWGSRRYVKYLGPLNEENKKKFLKHCEVKIEATE